jgi:hypothetical protein
MQIDPAGQRSPTLAATAHLVDLLRQPPESPDLVAALTDLGDRVANDFVDLLEFVSENEVDTRWRSPLRPPARVDRGDAMARWQTLRREPPPVTGEVVVHGELFRADSHSRKFRLDIHRGESITGSYSPDLVEQVRSAWAKHVILQLQQIQRRWIYSREPREIEYDLINVLEILGPAGSEAPEEET